MKKSPMSPARLKIKTFYPKLSAWPKLGAPVAVHVNVNSGKVLSVPPKLLRDAGLNPEAGLNVATHSGRALIWDSGKPGAVRMYDGMFRLNRTGVDAAVTGDNVAVVLGKGYAIVTTREDALKLAPNAPVTETAHRQRLVEDSIFVTARDLKVNAADILAWKDFNDFVPNPRSPVFRTFTVAGSICLLSGFQVGDAIRVLKYSNATVVEADEAGLRLRRTGPHPSRERLPRFNVPRNMFNSKGNVLRVIALSGKLVLCEPDSALAALCLPQKELPKNRHRVGAVLQAAGVRSAVGHSVPEPDVTTGLATPVQPTPATTASPVANDALAAPAHVRLVADGNTAVYPLKRESARLQVQGRWLRDFGFVPGSRYSIVAHPLFRNRLLLQLANDGRHQVTTMSGDTPKLYVPMSLLKQFSDATHVKVVGTPEGLHVMRDFKEGKAVQNGQVKAVPKRGAAKNSLKAA